MQNIKIQNQRELNIWFAQRSHIQKNELFNIWKANQKNQVHQIDFFARDPSFYSFSNNIITKIGHICGGNQGYIQSNFYLSDNRPVQIKFIYVHNAQFRVQDKTANLTIYVDSSGKLYPLNPNEPVDFLPSNIQNGDIVSVTRQKDHLIFRGQRNGKNYQKIVPMREKFNWGVMNENQVKVSFILMIQHDKIQVLKY